MLFEKTAKWLLELSNVALKWIWTVLFARDRLPPRGTMSTHAATTVIDGQAQSFLCNQEKI